MNRVVFGSKMKFNSIRNTVKEVEKWDIEYLDSERFKRKVFISYDTEKESEERNEGKAREIADFKGTDFEGKVINNLIKNSPLLLKEVERLRKGLDQLTTEYLKKAYDGEHDEEFMLGILRDIEEVLYGPEDFK